MGVAWDVTGDGRMAVRASYALAYDFMAGEYHHINSSAPPFGNRSLITIRRGGWTIRTGTSAAIRTRSRPTATRRIRAFGAFGTMDPDINSPRVQYWNVTLERQLGSDWGVAVSYLGSYSDRLWSQTAHQPGRLHGARAVHDA